MSEETVPVYGTLVVETEVKVAHFFVSCHRCGKEGSGESIGNGFYCDDCADDIWENVT